MMAFNKILVWGINRGPVGQISLVFAKIQSTPLY